MLSEYHKQLIIEQVSKYSGYETDLIDTSEIDSTLNYDEAKNEMFEKYGAKIEDIPYAEDYEKHLEKKQEVKFKNYSRNRFKRNTKQAYRNGLNMNYLFKEVCNTQPKSSRPKGFFRKFIQPKKKNISLNFNKVLSMCPDISYS